MRTLVLYLKSFHLKFVVNLVAAALGIIGTWLMSRRYAQQFWRTVFYALVTPLLFLVGKGKQARGFFTSKINANRDLPESVSTTVFGLCLLFWAFVFQLIALMLETEH